jgi:S1-C subfamily serine protease
MLLRILAVSLWILVLLPPASAQVSRRKGQKPRTTKSTAPAIAPATQGETKPGAITLRQMEPQGWVWVAHKIDLAQQLGGEDNIMTLDGEPLPIMQKRRVTLGLVIDDESHIITRLVDVTPSSPPINITVRVQGLSKPIAAKFLGMDTVTGLCILKTEGMSLKAPAFANPASLPLRNNIRLYGFHPNLNQNISAAMSLETPRRNTYPGLIAKAVNDFRYNAGNPIYYLLSPQLTPVQDCSLILEESNAVFGIAIYDIGSEGKHLVYPISRVQAIAQTVIKSHKSIAYGWLGATGRDVYAPIPTQLNKTAPPTELGVRITAVAPDSPAEVAGVKPLDVVVGVNDRTVITYAQMVTLMRQIPPDSEVTLRVRRGVEYKTLKAKLIPAPATEPEQQLIAFARRLETMEEELKELPTNDPNRQKLEPKLGVMKDFINSIRQQAPPDVRLRVFYGFEVQSLTAQLMNFFAVTNGVLVTNVVENNRAARHGLKAGDVIVRVGDKPVSNLSTLINALDSAVNEPVEISISRRREQMKMTLQH